jgi:hypothetical protein
LPTYLSDFGFKYDIFLSYGWAGNPDPNTGDRKWVKEFHSRLEVEIQARLGTSIEIYFDDYDGRTGFVHQNLEESIEHSALFLFLVSPGSCRQGSWCPRELQAFWDTAVPVQKLSRDQRVAALTIRPVPGPSRPELIGRLPQLHFWEPETEAPFLVAEIDVAGSRARTAFQLLCKDLSARLRNAYSRLNEPQPLRRRTFFFGTADMSLRDDIDYLRNNVENSGHRVILVTPGLDSELDFQRRTRDAVGKADQSVHFLGTAKLYPPARHQCRAALGTGHKIYIWQRPKLEYNEDHKAFLEEIRSNYASEGRIEFPVGEFSYFASNLLSDVQRADQREQLSQAPPESVLLPAPGSLASSAHGPRRVLLEYDAKDLRTINELVVPRLLSKGLSIVVPQAGPAGFESDLYSNSNGILVFFGAVSELWSFRRCSKIADRLGAAIALRNPLVFLAPPPEKPKEKSSFKFQPFRILKYEPGKWEQELDAWADQVAT